LDISMKAIVFDQFGPPGEVLTVRDMPRGEPGPGQVRVRMKLAPMNPSDMMVVRGQYGRLPKLPATPGFEGMGVIDAAGPGFLAKFRGLKPSRRVAVIHQAGGSWAEEAIVSARTVVPIPDAVPDDQAAAFFVNPATAIVMVNKVLQVPRGGWLLQTAAGSALGRMIIRLGKHQGFRTLNLIRRPDGAPELTRLGADAVVVLGDGVQEKIRAATGGEMVPHAIDCVGGAMGLEAVKALSPGGRLLLYGTLSGEPIPLNPRDLIGGSKRIDGFWLSDWVKEQHPITMLGLFRQITGLLQAGVLTTAVEATYSLGQIKDAAAHAEKPGRTGKILLRLAE
jgi:NADPH2:quinone reductase